MSERGFWQLDAVADAELELGLQRLIARGRALDARVVAHLAEVETRKLHLKSGVPSLFAYCQRRLNLSENQAFYRITAARVCRQYPVVFGMLEGGELHLSSVALLSKHLTAENHQVLLDQARGKTKLQLLELLAQHLPREGIESVIRELARPSLVRAVAAGSTGALEPLSPALYRLELNVNAKLKSKLELARDLMSHANPAGDLAAVVERALDVLIPRLQARRFGQLVKRGSSTSAVGKVVSPAAKVPVARTSASSTSTVMANADGAKRRRHPIPREILRQLVARDGDYCSFVGTDGERCGSRAFLQVDHELAWAKGGADELDNLRLRCGAHNRLQAELEFGTTSRAS
jgi:hypothetical protein